MTNFCKVCGATDKDAEFYTGVTSRCKECHKRLVKENREAKADYYREYDANRFQNDPKVLERHKRYSRTLTGKQSLDAAKKKWAAQNPDKRAAQIILGNAVKYGKIVKPEACSKCGKKERKRCIHAHHHDYSLPLDVIWLCAKCHAGEHKT